MNRDVQSYNIDIDIEDSIQYREDRRIRRSGSSTSSLSGSISRSEMRRRRIRERNRIENINDDDESSPLIVTEIRRGERYILQPDNLLLENECTICLDEFVIDDDLKLLDCGHSFHIECIDDWFKRNISCPICRQDC